jgi:hypothetical protein
MTLRMRYGFIAALVLYWPFIFLLAHVPQVPRWILRTQMSDKTLHYLGYLLLVFLWWFAAFPSKRPSFFSRPLWFTVAMMLVYAAADEWLQRFTHRTPDIYDFFADMVGVLTGLVIFAIAGLRLSALAVSAFIIFVLTSFCKADPLAFVPFIDILFYIGAYALVTFLWMHHLRETAYLRSIAFLLAGILLPAVLLAVTAIVAPKFGKVFEADRLMAAIGGIAVSSIVTSVVYACRWNRTLTAASAAEFGKMKIPNRQ